MLYLIDERDRATTKPPLTNRDFRGVLSWQQLGGLEVSLALALDIPDVMRRFIAGAIQYQFCRRRHPVPVLPTRHSSDRARSALS